MNIASLCQRPVVSIDQAASLADAARLMRSQHVGALVVTSESEFGPQAMGVVTDRDLVVEVLARELDGSGPRIGQLAQRQLAAVPGTADLGAAVAVMRQAGVRRLLVVDRDEGRLLGLVASEDLLDALVADLAGLAQALRADIAHETSARPPLEPAATARPVFLPGGTPGMPWPKA
jgi:CBS domain-containing protein